MKVEDQQITFVREVVETHRRLMILPSLAKSSAEDIALIALTHTSAAWRVANRYWAEQTTKPLSIKEAGQ